ncbi:MAG: peptidoglycan DD-metalloendopeptidase family protein [Leptospiraceae bacterium]|nr:peptidoglycan DD-metalloendopeptidase family protein [Leptospiraceae bacterium]MCP5499770.1 peptidoglycan DD-metalloendopeptidase family protein [Leptospiraceae bacterium]
MIFLKPRKLTHGHEILRTSNATLIYLGSASFHFSYKLKSRLFFGSLDFKKRRFQLIPLFLSAFSITAFLGFGPIHTSAGLKPDPILSNTEAVENDIRDMEAKNADDIYLRETEEQKRAILNASEDDNEFMKKTHYTIKTGENLNSVLKKFNLKAEELEVKKGRKYNLKPGDVVLLPGRNGLIHTMKKGESLARLIDQYGLSVRDVLIENKLGSADIFEPGDKVFLPGAVAPVPEPTWYLPVSSRVITSDYAYRTYPRSHFHDALDLKANYESVKAARSGKIIYSGWMGGYGNVIIIQHTDNFKTLYAHNSKLYVKRGDKIQGGRVISRSGCTGYCFGAHLHFEVIKNGKTVDPKKYLKGLRYK